MKIIFVAFIFNTILADFKNIVDEWSHHIIEHSALIAREYSSTGSVGKKGTGKTNFAFNPKYGMTIQEYRLFIRFKKHFSDYSTSESVYDVLFWNKFPRSNHIGYE